MLHDHLSRRAALKLIYQAIVTAGAGSFISFSDLLKAEDNPDQRVNVVWLHGSSCSGCSVSFLDIDYVPVVDILTKFTNLIFHPDVSSATGHQVPALLEQLRTSGLPYVLVVEGGIPVAMPHACMMGGKPIIEWISLLAKEASACIAAGTCAALGGVTTMHGTETGSVTLADYLTQSKIKVPVVNLPACPMRPEHFVYTVLFYASQKALPELDEELRPKKFFAHTVHERCNLYSDFQENRFARFIGDDGCLQKLGCQGPVTHNDCMVRGHNGNTNTCIRAGHPCIGCASEHFPRRIMLHNYDEQRIVLGKDQPWNDV